MKHRTRKTRFKDKNGEAIYIGDVISVEEYPDKYVGGSLNYEGVVYYDSNGRVEVEYSDIGITESYPLAAFPVQGRQLLTEKSQKEYWRIALLGGEPEERLWKRKIYRNMPLPGEGVENDN